MLIKNSAWSWTEFCIEESKCYNVHYWINWQNLNMVYRLKYSSNIEFPQFDNRTVIIWKRTLKCKGIKGHDVCHLLLNGSKLIWSNKIYTDFLNWWVCIKGIWEFLYYSWNFLKIFEIISKRKFQLNKQKMLQIGIEFITCCNWFTQTVFQERRSQYSFFTGLSYWICQHDSITAITTLPLIMTTDY